MFRVYRFRALAAQESGDVQCFARSISSRLLPPRSSKPSQKETPLIMAHTAMLQHKRDRLSKSMASLVSDAALTGWKQHRFQELSCPLSGLALTSWSGRLKRLQYLTANAILSVKGYHRVAVNRLTQAEQQRRLSACQLVWQFLHSCRSIPPYP